MSVLNLTERQRRVLADSYDERRMTFERILKADLRKFFTSMGNELFASLAANRAPVDFQGYTRALVEILRKNYRNTGEFFRMHLNRLLNTFMPKAPAQKEAIEELQEVRRDIEPLLLLGLIPIYDNMARQHASYIITTTETAFGSLDRPQGLTPMQSARKISRDFRKRNLKRVPGIAENEVGSAANVATDQEGRMMQRGIATSRIDAEVLKTWMSIIDENTRPGHIRANNQKKPIDTAFVVSGQLLRYPKDSSLGASLSNILGCRCSTITEV